MAAAQLHLDQMIVYLDHNHMQVDCFLKDIIELEPTFDKWVSFGWHTQRIDGHDLSQILSATQTACAVPGRPHMIICDTVKGKGISYMENQVMWHSHPIDEAQYRQALADLDCAEQMIVV